MSNDIISAILIETDDSDDEFNLLNTNLKKGKINQLDSQDNKEVNLNNEKNNLDEEDEGEVKINVENNIIKNNNKKITIKQKILLDKYFTEDLNIIEIGVDEVGRGPLFGRVYSSAVVLPKTNIFNHCDMKDSKKFSSKKKILSTAEYIKKNAIAWSVKYEDENTIDSINILQATQLAMHNCIIDVIDQLKDKTPNLNLKNILLLIDGNYFKPLVQFDTNDNKFYSIRYNTIEQGDNKYTSIAAASILAKVERDNYIDKLCEDNPELIEKYKINTNKGYGSKHHIDGIKKHGITKWHRKTFGICKNYF